MNKDPSGQWDNVSLTFLESVKAVVGLKKMLKDPLCQQKSGNKEGAEMDFSKGFFKANVKLGSLKDHHQVSMLGVSDFAHQHHPLVVGTHSKEN